jgi:hypothetical protein
MRESRDDASVVVLQPRLLSKRATAAYLSISLNQVTNMIQAGLLPLKTIPFSTSPGRDSMGKVFVDRVALDAVVDSWPSRQ